MIHLYILLKLYIEHIIYTYTYIYIPKWRSYQNGCEIFAQQKNVFLITLKNIAHCYYNTFEEYIYIYILVSFQGFFKDVAVCYFCSFRFIMQYLESIILVKLIYIILVWWLTLSELNAIQFINERTLKKPLDCIILSSLCCIKSFKSCYSFICILN